MSLPIAPDLDAVLALDGPETHVVLSVTLLADLETPVSLFRKLASNTPGSFLLESAGGGEAMGRWSFLGVDPVETLRIRNGVAEQTGSDGRTRRVACPDPLELVRDRLERRTFVTSPGLPRFHGGAVGYLGFELLATLEGLPVAPRPGLGLPLGVLLFVDRLLAYDHFSRRLLLLRTVPLHADPTERERAYAAAERDLAGQLARLAGSALSPEEAWVLDPTDVGPDSPTSANRSEDDYRDAVSRAREAIEAGEVFQVVVSRRLDLDADVDPFALYRALRATNPSPYLFYFDFGDFQLVGASPEVLVRVDPPADGGQVLVRPIAGTRPRGRDPAHEAALEAELRADEKELAEHRMLVDLGRNDVGRVAAPGSVEVRDPLHVERYSHVMHLVTDVVGQLRDGHDAFDVFRSCFPAGTVSGAPKLRAVELLADLEPDRRGPYAGAVGYFGADGAMDMAIAIRTLVVQPGSVHVQAGAGIVHDSDPHSEARECLHKCGAGLDAVRRTVARSLRASEPEATS
jgi:anthranilate synthase component I